MIVVSDSSPILNLSVVGRLELLRSLFGRLVVPESVADELASYGVTVDPEWMSVTRAQDRRWLAILLRDLDPGEAEAIVIAEELQASLILMDERRGRRIASGRGLEYMGLLGILAEAKNRRLIPECRGILNDMMRDAGFWIGDELRSRFLRGVNEAP